MDQNLNVRLKTKNLLKENRSTSRNFGLGNDLLHVTPRTKVKKEKNNIN